MIADDERDNTTRAYAADWRDWEGWCGRRGFRSIPASPEAIALYLRGLDNAGRRYSTIRRRLAAINQRHRAAKLASPTSDALVHDVMDDIREMQDLAQIGKTPLLTHDLRRMLAVLPASVSGIRDRALLLVGFAGGLRRSELVALDIDDIERQPDEMLVRLPAGRGRSPRETVVELPRQPEPATCAVAATEAWLDAGSLSDGPLFRSINRHGQIGERRLSDKSVALIVKRVAEDAGLDPARYAASSLRSGAAIERRLAG
ncbi:MAG TPA: tyrosine-type recombinase/integrase [Thermomicrobiales bacterium]|nr:tyrosine-type recombinase/integrase [Thermomicrobiales bacterium]